MHQCRQHFCLADGKTLLISRKLTAIQGVVITLGFGDVQLAGFFLAVIELIGWRLVHTIRVLVFLCLLFSSRIKLTRILILNEIISLSRLKVTIKMLE